MDRRSEEARRRPLPKLDDDAGLEAYREELRKSAAYIYMPALRVAISTAVLEGGGSFADVKATVEMTLHASKAYANDYLILVASPTIEVWSSTTWWKGPQGTFNQHVLPISDELIKELVNVWTKTQNSPF